MISSPRQAPPRPGLKACFHSKVVAKPLQSGGSLSLPAWGETAEDSDNFPGISVFQGRNRVGIRLGAPALRRLSAFAPASVLRN